MLVDVTTGKYLFTADFSDLGQGPKGATDDPGFQTLNNTFTPGLIFNFRAVGSLRFWNGETWVNDIPNQEVIRIEDALNITTISPDTITNQVGAIIDMVSNTGMVHHTRRVLY